jgi:hypothetical protein
LRVNTILLTAQFIDENIRIIHAPLGATDRASAPQPVVSGNPNAPTDLVGNAREQNVAAMTSQLPTHLWLGILAGGLNRHQQAVIEYLRTENKSLDSSLMAGGQN